MKIQFSDLEWKLHKEIVVNMILALFNFGCELKPEQLLPSNLLKDECIFYFILLILKILF